MTIINLAKKYYLDIVLVLLITYLLRTLLVDQNFYIQQQRLLSWLIVLLIASLWLKKEVIKISLDWYVLIGIVLFIVFLSVNSSEKYLNSSIKSSLDLSILAIVFLLYVNFQTQIQRNPKWIIGALLFIFFTMPAYVTLQEMFIPVAESSTELKVKSWGYKYFPHIRHFSYQAFIASALSYILLTTSKGQHLFIRVLFGVIFLCSLLCILLAAGRASILALLVFVFLNTFMQSWSIFRSTKQAGKIVALIFLCYSVIFFTPFDSSFKIVFSHFINAAQVTDGGLVASLDTFSSGRLEVWTASLKYAVNSPVFGHGSSAYSFSPLPSAGKYAHSHNSIIQFILEYGYLGATIIIFAMHKLLRPFFNFSRPLDDIEKLRRMVLAFILSFIFYSLFTGLFFHTLPILQFSIMVMILFALDRCGHTESEK